MAEKEAITLDDIADEPIPRWSDPEWNAFWRIDPRPDGSRPPDGPLVEAMDDKLEIIAAGQAIAIVSAGLRAETLRDDLTTIPLKDVDPSHVIVATRPGDPDPLVTSFRETAQAHLTTFPG
ncbi:LysR substrate-binding domain-containing protein [Actinomadura sp. SCN-SB]|uniref:LysR substrate-binding domain-containing protein n=1 Tax=Actinomadura sp. SCN-SB TaxID=3373092 RepID=UPI0037516348